MKGDDQKLVDFLSHQTNWIGAKDLEEFARSQRIKHSTYHRIRFRLLRDGILDRDYMGRRVYYALASKGLKRNLQSKITPAEFGRTAEIALRKAEVFDMLQQAQPLGLLLSLDGKNFPEPKSHSFDIPPAPSRRKE